MRRHIRNLIGVFLILCGIGIYAYPAITTEMLDRETEQYIEEFDKKWEDAQKKTKKEKEKDPLYQEILAYNETIYETGQKDFKDAWSYVQSPINLKGLPDEKFGYIKIPAMDVKLPLYLGASESNMRKGAAILGQTSIPIGGKNTNSVIAGHRGYSGIPYFREIEKLDVGDKVIIKNPWEKLTYRVEAISIIDPYDSDAVRIQEGKDMITLVTCHPYRSHGKYRYIVYCVRDKNGEDSSVKKEQKKTNEEIQVVRNEIPFFSSEDDIKREQLFRQICAGIILVAVVIGLISSKRKR